MYADATNETQQGDVYVYAVRNDRPSQAGASVFAEEGTQVRQYTQPNTGARINGITNIGISGDQIGILRNDRQNAPALEDLIAMEAAKKAAEDAMYQPAEPPVTFSVPGTTQHYTRREQIRDPDSMEWVPYRRRRVDYGSQPPDDPDNVFFLNSRRDYYGDPPTLVITNLSQPLLLFLRSCAGNRFYWSDPEVAISAFLERMIKIKAKAEEIKAIVEKDSTQESQIKLWCDIGLSSSDAEEDQYDLQVVNTDLTKLQAHISVLLDCLQGFWDPIEKRLQDVKAFGRIDYTLLQYYFCRDDELVAIDEECKQQIAFRCDNMTYTSIAPGKEVFLVHGEHWEWSGEQYDLVLRHFIIPKFFGPIEVDKLPIQHLNQEQKVLLKERGKKYVDLSGIHYKLWANVRPLIPKENTKHAAYLAAIHIQGRNKERIIVDRYAWGNRSGYEDPIETAEITEMEIDDTLFHLLPPQVHGFNLAQKLWGSFNVKDIHEVEFDEDAWDHLVLDSRVKKLIRGLVNQTVNQAGSTESGTQVIKDVISGKGGGLVSVLHGPPGTGKTLTAEAVAEYLHRPLYAISSTQLSTSIDKLEANLKSILKLAKAWNAVLLIDEADVFLEQRSLHDLERNQLVSVALRTLEYHDGVLFLTTNRVKTFDEAFLSRISLAIHYPELSAKDKTEIWAKFFDRAGCDSIPREDIESLATKPLNGRDIKNVVRTAQSLALSLDESFSMEHVLTVVSVQEQFLKSFTGEQKCEK